MHTDNPDAAAKMITDICAGACVRAFVDKCQCGRTVQKFFT